MLWNYGRIEAHYSGLDLLEMSCRRLCHLILEWLLEKIDGETWDREYKDIFFGDPEKRRRADEAKKHLKPSVPGQAGSLDLRPVEKTAPADLAAIIGKYGKGVAPERKSPSGPNISTGPDGSLTVDQPEVPEG